MQARYLCIVPHDPAQVGNCVRRLSTQLRSAAGAYGERFAIWVNDVTTVTRIADARSALVGELFAHPDQADNGPGRDAPERLPELPEIVRRFWGAYMVFTNGERDGSATIFRAPIGALPCYYIKMPDGWAFASDVDLLVEANILVAALDWTSIAAHLASTTIMREDTCLAGVRELLPGCALRLTQDGSVRLDQIWSFWDYAAPINRSIVEDIDELRSTVLSATRLMAREHRSIGVSVSGGLDSSIVLAALVQVGVAVRPFTLIGIDPDADETHYVHPLARHLGVELVEFGFDACDVDLSRSSVRHLPRPIGHTHAQTVAAKHRLMQDRFGVDAVFTGMGGDSIFCTNSSSLPLVDRIKAEGPMPSVETLRALRRITGASIFDIGRQAIRIATMGRRPNWDSKVGDLLVEELRAPGSNPLAAAWFNPPPGSLPGKTFHIEMLVGTYPAVEGFDRSDHPALLSPLLAQPVVERCLRIPSWRWSSGGQNRSVAREAFRSALPEIVVDRRSKGGPDTFSRDVALARRRQVREMLLDGALVRHDILDRRAIENALSERALLAEARHSHLLHLVDVEAWIAHWSGREAVAVPPASLRSFSHRP
jgi:asparagine synthase (glutamine-hydrolysing)